MLESNHLSLITVERQLACEHLIHDNPKAPPGQRIQGGNISDILPVYSSPILTASKHFGGKVGRSTTEGASQFVSKNFILAQTKVNHLNVTVSIQQKILQFEVPIYDPPFVQVPKCAHYFGSIKPENKG